MGSSINSNIDSRSAGTPQNERLSTADTTQGSDGAKTEETGRAQIPTPLSSEENKD